MCGAHAGAIFKPDGIPNVEPKRIPDKRAIVESKHIADTRAIVKSKQGAHSGSDPADAGTNGCGTPNTGTNPGANGKANSIAIGARRRATSPGRPRCYVHLRIARVHDCVQTSGSV